VGAAEHRAAAKREERRLARHQELYDPKATQKVRRCDTARRAVLRVSCAGLAPDDRDVSPFSHRADILGVSPLEAGPAQPRQKPRTVGATVLFRPVPGLTVAELQQLVACHLARNATIGYEKAGAEMGGCLLTQQGTQATVRALESGFAVDIRADSPTTTGQEIWRRAQPLASVN
jgi:hypothetical protein